LSLKLGTITSEGTASIHCYACDEEVHDEKLAEHLSVLGIDIATQSKTEKTVTELNLEANLSLTLSKVIEEGKVLVPVFGPGLTGMENLGNSCYINSVVQILFSFPEFRNFYEPNAAAHLKNCQKFSPDCYQCQIFKLAQGLYSGEYSQK
jgi:ubiquitin carboxyl-terminal hydrolase 5/13